MERMKQGRIELLQRWRDLRDEVAQANVRLIAVSKYAEDEPVQWLIEAGETMFGESRPQSLRDRALQWPRCAWHMIGPLQSNKAKYIGRHAAMWHSVEDLATAKQVARYVEGRKLPVLIQVNMSAASHHHGIMPEQAGALLDAIAGIDDLELKGLMCLAPREGDTRAAFKGLRDLRQSLFGGSFAELCMGMSGDFRIAIEEGATMVRIGSTLFGDLDTRK